MAVDGPCLTVVGTDDGRWTFTVEVMPETYRKTTLHRLSRGSHVNLEPSLEFGGSVGGHLVTGHVDGTGTVRDVRREENARVYEVRPPSALLPYVAPKGSISVDGVSLTVVDVGRTFTVSVTDFTYENTVFEETGVGDEVNLEVDLVARYLDRLVRAGRIEGGDSTSRGLHAGAVRDDASTDVPTRGDEPAGLLEKLGQLEGRQ